MNRVFIGIVTVIVLIFGTTCGLLYFRTTQRSLEIESLQGSIGDFDELTKVVRTRYQRLEASQDVEVARQKLGTSSGANLLYYRFKGEGLPYFRGCVGYEAGKQRVVTVAVDEPW